MKKYLSILVISLVAFIPNIHATMTDDIITARNDTANTVMLEESDEVIIDGEIPGEYSFALGKNNATYVVSGNDQLSETLIQRLSQQEGFDTVTYVISHADIASQVTDEIKGRYSILYKNVDIYDNQFIDVKMTIMDFDVVGWRDLSVTDSAIVFGVDEIGVYAIGVRWVTVKYEFFKAGTNEPISVKGNTTYWDVDAYQGIIIQDGNSGIYAASCGEDCKLKFTHLPNDNGIYIYSPLSENDTSLYNRIYSFTETFEGTSITRTYQYNNPKSAGWTVTSGLILNSSQPVVSSSLSAAEKKVSSDKIQIGKEFTYTIHQSMPLLLSQFYYKSFEIVDELEPVLEADINNVSITDEDGNDVSDLFEFEQDKQKLILRAKDTNDESFYQHSYIIKIKTKIKDVDLSKYKKDGKYVISNKVTSTYTDYNDEEKTLDSNVVDIIAEEPQKQETKEETTETKNEKVKVPDTGMNGYLFVCMGIVAILIGAYILIKKRLEENINNKN